MSPPHHWLRTGRACRAMAGGTSHSLHLKYAAPVVDDAFLCLAIEQGGASNCRNLAVGGHVRRRLEAAPGAGSAGKLLDRGLSLLAHQPVDDHAPGVGMRRL